MHLVCPDCGTTNRVPDARLDDGPVCGRCHTPLRPTVPVALDDRRFAGYIGQDQPVLVDYWAAWCGPCRQMAPQFERAAGLLPGVRFAKLDTDANPVTASARQIRSIPTLALYHRGQELARRAGATGATELVQWVRQELSRAGIPH